MADRDGTPAPERVAGPVDGDLVTQALAEELRSDRVRVAAARRLESPSVGSRALERLAHLAARLLGAGAAQVSLLADEQTVAGGAGLPEGSVGVVGPMAESLCTVTAAGTGPLLVTDAVHDPRVAHLPPVLAGAVGSYLGMPLLGAGGVVVGALCVFDPAPRTWSDADVVLIGQLADSVATELELSALSKEFAATRLRWGLAIDAAGIGSFDWDLETGRLAWDDRLVELFGYERATFGETIEDFNARLHPDDVPRVADALQLSIDTVGPFEAEYRVVLPSGVTRWVVGRGRALAGDDGRAVRVLGAAYDTTGGRDADARVSRVLESMSAAFYSLDREWRFTYVNAEAERLLQRPREELLGGVIWDLFPATRESIFETSYRGAAATNLPDSIEAYYPPPLDGWFEIRVWPNPSGLSVYFLEITARRQAQERAARSTARLAMIAEVTAAFGATLAGDQSTGDALDQLAASVVPVLGDTAWVCAADADGRLRELDPVPPGAASAVSFPLVARGRTVGALSIARGPARPPLDDDDLAAGREVADRAALALDSVRLYEQQRRIAEELQRSLLTAPPATPGARVAVRYLPAAEAAQVGGDWYDAFHQPDGGTMLVIGDVVGHDIEAAASMGQLRGLLRGIAFRSGWGPAAVLTDLDRAITGLQLDTMGTAAIARLEPGDDSGTTRISWSNAGHPPIVVLHVDGTVEEVDAGRADLMLGVDARFTRRDHELLVESGAVVLLYTDGLVESRDMPLDDGLARLAEVLADLGPVGAGGPALEAFCDQIVARLRPAGFEDDVALVAVRLD